MPKTIKMKAKMSPGQCKRTKRGVKYCRTSKGVRFVGK